MLEFIKALLIQWALWKWIHDEGDQPWERNP